VLVPDKDEYAILADVLREARAKNNRDSGMDERIFKAEPAQKRTAHRERGRLIGMTRNYSYTKHQRMTKTAPQAMQAAIKRSRWKPGSADNRERKQHQSDPYSHHRAPAD
jgi:hypothetical protein